jgi:hypothetical protein
MKGKLIKIISAIFFVAIFPATLLANNVKPFSAIRSDHFVSIALSDTLVPPAVKNVQTDNSKSEKIVIKVVPKPRRQIVPVPVIKVKPLRTIKPKIIKPVIKVIH